MSVIKRVKNRTIKINWRVLGVFSILLFIPLALENLDFRGQLRELEINVDPSTPAMAAFIDATNDNIYFSNEQKAMAPNHQVVRVEPISLDLALSAPIVPNLSPNESDLKEVNPYLLVPQLSILEIFDEVEAFAPIEPNDRSKIKLTRAPSLAMMPKKSSQPKQLNLPVKGTKTNSKEEKIQRGIRTLQADTRRLPTLRERASELISQELSRIDEENPGTWSELNTQAGGEIKVSSHPIAEETQGSGLKSEANQNQAARPHSINLSKSPVGVPTNQGGGQESQIQSGLQQQSTGDDTHGGSDSGGFQSAVVGLVAEDDVGPFSISGELLLTEGVAFGGNESRIEVYHVVDEQIWTEGTVNVFEGLYEIEVESLRGHLIVELRDPEGSLQSSTELSLADFYIEYEQNESIRSFKRKLKLRPSGSGIIVDVVSSNSTSSRRIEARGAKLYIEPLASKITRDNKSGLFKDETLMNSSTYMYFAEQKEHWGSVAVGVAGEKNRLRMFSDQSIQSLLELGRPFDEYGRLIDYSNAKEAYESVIWGRITIDGKPVKGARVELEGGNRARPIYFFENFLPDASATHSSENGLFALINVSPGIQVLRAKYRGNVISTAIVPSEAQYVSYVKLDASAPRTVAIDVFDALKYDEPMSVSINLWGQNSKFNLDSGSPASLRFKTGYGLVGLEAIGPSRYEISNVVTHRFARTIKIPMVRVDWLSEVASRRKINRDIDTARVFGLLGAGRHKVELIKIDGVLADEQVVYFSDKGSILSREPLANKESGGFAIFNVQPGLRTIKISSETSDKIWSQLFYADVKVVSTFQFDGF